MVNQFLREPGMPSVRTDTLATAAENTGSMAAELLLAGQRHDREGHIDEAICAYQSGLDAAMAAGADRIGVDLLFELHSRLGNACMAGRRFSSAAAQYECALRLKPMHVACWCNLGDALLQSGRAMDAIALYSEALKLDPAHWTSRANLAQALMATKQYPAAKTLLTKLAQERPQDGQLRHLLGKTSFELNDMEEALRHFADARALDPGNADSLYWIGGVRQRIGDIDAAQAAYAQAAQIQPPLGRRAATSPADFRLLALFAPFAGNMPVEYLLKDAAYDTETLALFDGREPDAASGDVQLVVNLISDADQARTMLPPAVSLVEKLGKPVINDPGRIRHTARDAAARLLAGIPGCRIPAILRVQAGADISVPALDRLLPFSFPVLARPAGTHGGGDFEKIASRGELAVFSATAPTATIT